MSVFVLTEGSSEGYASFSDHLRGCFGGLQGLEGVPANYWSATEKQHPCTGPGLGFCCPTAGLTLPFH